LAKRFELLHALVPQTKLMGVLRDSTNIRTETLQEVEAAARSMGVSIRVIAVSNLSDIEAAFATFAGEGVNALFVMGGYLFYSLSDRLAALAVQHRIAASGEARVFVEAGGLMSYGPNETEGYRQVGRYAGRILKGEKPADLPVMQPTQIDLVLNLRTAKAIGLTVPPNVLAVADKVIE
jgi:putative tryptophan/tyrosine transport system substrate-binding protein